MATLSGVARAAAGAPATGLRVRAELTDVDGNPVTAHGPDGTIVQPSTVVASASGAWSFDLAPNAEMDRTGTYYTITIDTGTAADTWLIEKGAGAETLEEAVATSPTALGSAATLGSLADVSTTGATEGQALVYDATAGEWEPGTVAGGGGTVDSVVEGDRITVDATDPANPIVTAAAAPVTSVNGDVGVVVLGAADVGADATGTASSAVSAHSADTTSVHGIADTSDLIVEGDFRLTDARTPTAHTQAASTITDFATAAGAVAVGGDLTGTVGNAAIAAGTISNDDVNASAAIALSKLATDPLARANHTGTQAGSTVDAATDSARGTVELATTAEVQTGTDETRVATPAGVAAATPNIVSVPLVTGRYHASVSHNSTQVLTANVCLFQPVVFRRGATLDRVGVILTSAAGSSAVRIGLYEDADGLPGTLVADFGTVATTSGTGVRETTISQTVTRARYWACVVAQGGTPSVRSGGGVVLPYSLGSASSSVFDVAGFFYSYFTTGVTGALPTPAASPTLTSDQAPTILWRAS